MTEGICHCGHERHRHKGANERCGAMITSNSRTWAQCPCRAFDNSVLPADGERLEFGKHRQPAPDAETAPMWPPLKGPA